MRNKYTRRFSLKLMICILGMAVLFFIAMSYRNYIIKEGKVPYLTVKEILPVIEAFSEIQGLTVYEEVWQNRVKNADEYVTAGEIRTLLTFFPEIEDEVLQDYKKDSWYIGISDWNRILTGLVKLYGKDDIVLGTVAIIATGQEVMDEAGTGIEKTQVLTDQGIRNAVYWNTDAYLYSTVTAVCYGADILAVTGYADETLGEKNVYLAGVSDETYHFFVDGYHIRYSKTKGDGTDFSIEYPDNLTGSELVDLVFDKGTVKIEQKKTEYVNGKLLKISENGFEIEGYGLYEADDNLVVYRIYGELASKKISDLRIGYDFTDFVLENGRITACLMIRDEDMKSIRVLLKNSGYEGRNHERFTAVCDQDYEVIYYENGMESGREKKKAGEELSIACSDLKADVERIKLVPAVLSAQTRVDSIARSQGNPSYKGSIEITREEEGLLIVNEVLLEDYLRYVVPSEMPSGYPKEALMAQAVCARTYAYGKMKKAGLPAFGAHVDDSAGFQVYNNIKEQDSTTEAVRATHNQIAEYQGEPIGTYYYSTSCGVGSDAAVWHGSGESPDYLVSQIISLENEIICETEERDGESVTENTIDEDELVNEDKFREWIQSTDEDHFEVQEGWYRWSYEVEELDASRMEEVLRKRFNSNPALILTQNENGEFESKEISELGKIKDIEIIKRLPGGVADELLITGSKAQIKVISELNIRYVLSDGITKVIRQSQDQVDASSALPSAFIIIDTHKAGDEVKGYSVTGGGFGHGVGMSQNGAKNMAEKGMTCEQILGFYYPGVEVTTLEFGE